MTLKLRDGVSTAETEYGMALLDDERELLQVNRSLGQLLGATEPARRRS